MPLFIISLGIIFLFILIIFFRLNAFIAFIIISLSVGIAQGMNLVDVIESIEKGIGNTLGFLVMILGLGAMLGKIVADSGAAQQITNGLIRLFGVRNTKWAVMLTYSSGFSDPFIIAITFSVSTVLGF